MAAPPKRERAAVYARMSTDRQTISIPQQLDTMRSFAADNDLEIVRTYLDEGITGLVLKKRLGLRSMLADILEGRADYSVVLVLDVSRFGRFQDADESAHYEFLCKQAGVRIIYCAEQFKDDDSPLSVLVKGIKRAMAAEYSRELSAKVFAAQCRLFRAGFKSGGNAGYGLRRVVFSADGEAKQTLYRGDRKPAITDRVRIMLGPPEEVATVRRIYHLFVAEKYGDVAIAKFLNADGLRNEVGEAWRPTDVKSILTNSKYCGRLIFGRTSKKLAGAAIKNKEEEWVQYTPEFEPIVSEEVFESALTERERRKSPRSDDEVLDMVRMLYEKHGNISARIIRTDPRMLKPGGLAKRFGTLAQAYLLAGLPMTKYIGGALTKNVASRAARSVTDHVKRCIHRAGGTYEAIDQGGLLLVNDRFRVRVCVACCRNEPGDRRWYVTIHDKRVSDFVICARLNRSNDQVMDYYLFSTSAFSTQRIWMNAAREREFSKFRHQTVETIFGLPEL